MELTWDRQQMRVSAKNRSTIKTGYIRGNTCHTDENVTYQDIRGAASRCRLHEKLTLWWRSNQTIEVKQLRYVQRRLSLFDELVTWKLSVNGRVFWWCSWGSRVREYMRWMWYDASKFSDDVLHIAVSVKRRGMLSLACRVMTASTRFSGPKLRVALDLCVGASTKVQDDPRLSSWMFSSFSKMTWWLRARGVLGVECGPGG